MIPPPQEFVQTHWFDKILNELSGQSAFIYVIIHLEGLLCYCFNFTDSFLPVNACDLNFVSNCLLCLPVLLVVCLWAKLTLRTGLLFFNPNFVCVSVVGGHD